MPLSSATRRPVGAARAFAVLFLVALTRCVDAGPDVTPAKIVITPAAGGTITSGTTLSLTAVVSNAAGGVLANQVVDWMSDDPAVADVSPLGIVTGSRVGQTQLTASVGALRSASVTITVTPGTATQLAVRTQPAGAAAGLPLKTQPAIEIRDAAGNVVTSSNLTVTAVIATGGGAVTGSTATADAGVATFSDLTIRGSVGDRTLAFSVAGLTSVSSSGFALEPGLAAKLLIRTEPTGALSGAPLGVQPVLEFRDEWDNIATSSTETVTATLGSGGGTLTAGTIAAVGGVATFGGLTITGLIGSRTLVFTAPGVPSVNSASFTLGFGRAALLRIRRQPEGSQSGLPLGAQPIVEITDTGGNVVPTSTGLVVAEIASGGGAIAGASATVVDGVATFSALSITGIVGPRLLTFSAAGLPSVTSAPFSLSSGVPKQMIIRVQPGQAASGVPLGIQPVIAVVDEAGNLATTFSGVVSVGLYSGGGTLAFATAGVVNGLSSFRLLTINRAVGTVSLVFRLASFPDVVSSPINVAPGPATRLVIRTAPPLIARNGIPMSPQPVIELLDSGGNRASSSVTVTMSTDAVSGSIINATATAINGVATFSGLTLAGPLGERNYQFIAPGTAPTAIIRIGIVP
jgi:hypothetical protein